MSIGAPNLTTSWRPATFVERGLAVPFTSPLLSHARLRPARKGRVELVMPNPAGGAGFYVLGLEGAQEVVRLTVHDRLLTEELLKLPGITPGGLRRAARRVAAEGSAGRLAAEAAQAAARREEQDRLLTNVLLIVRLLRQAGNEDIDLRKLSLDGEAARAEVRGLLAGIAPRFGLTPDELFAEVEKLAEIAAPVGFADGEFRSEAAEAVDTLRGFAPSVRQWAGLEQPAAREAAELLADCGDLTLREAEGALGAAWKLLRDPLAVLRSWLAGRGDVVQSLSLPVWLLDGWPEICQIWSNAAHEDRPAQRAAIEAIEALVPVLPREFGRYTESDDLPDEKLRARGRWVRLYEDWRTGRVLTSLAVAENEALRAACA
ncbi:MAG: hypothetical protein U1E14_18795 [Geminicoccaceae bacterium]